MNTMAPKCTLVLETARLVIHVVWDVLTECMYVCIIRLYAAIK